MHIIRSVHVDYHSIFSFCKSAMFVPDDMQLSKTNLPVSFANFLPKETQASNKQLDTSRIYISLYNGFIDNDNNNNNY